MILSTLQKVYSTGSVRAKDAPCLLAGVVVEDSAAGTYIIHDSLNADSAFLTLRLGAAGTVVCMFPAPVILSKGCYFETASASCAATLLFA